MFNVYANSGNAPNETIIFQGLLSLVLPSLVAGGTFEDFKLICLQLPLKLSLVGK